MFQNAAFNVSGASRQLRNLFLPGLALVFAVAALETVRADEGVTKTTKSSDETTEKKPQTPAKAVADKKANDAPGTDLLKNELTKDWKHFSSKDSAALASVWQMNGAGDDKQLICVGEPQGFLYTRKQYSDFELTFEWKVPDANANSGVLIYTQDEPRLWPTSMQVQLHQPQAGDIFPSGDAEGNTTQAPPKLSNEVGKWNKCRIVSINGQILSLIHI